MQRQELILLQQLSHSTSGRYELQAGSGEQTSLRRILALQREWSRQQEQNMWSKICHMENIVLLFRSMIIQEIVPLLREYFMLMLSNGTSLLPYLISVRSLQEYHKHLLVIFLSPSRQWVQEWTLAWKKCVSCEHSWYGDTKFWWITWLVIQIISLYMINLEYTIFTRGSYTLFTTKKYSSRWAQIYLYHTTQILSKCWFRSSSPGLCCGSLISDMVYIRIKILNHMIQDFY